MIVRMNGTVISEPAPELVAHYEDKIKKAFKKYVMPASIAVGILNRSTTVFAEVSGTKTIAESMMPLIDMIQDLALPIGIAISSWGLIEIIAGNFGSGKDKVKYAVIGFAGMFLVPEIFYAIRGAFTND